MKHNILILSSIFIIILFIGINHDLASQVSKQDSLALVALYDSTDGNNWEIKTNWLTNQPAGTWYGVTIESGRVREIILTDNNLTGSIPPEIGNLTDLRSINLRQNNLEGSIPSQIGNLTKLESLDIYQNELTGELPPEMGNMTQLSFIKLSNNLLTGTIPEEFTNLSNLETLAISSNHLSGDFPMHVLSMSKLEYLWFQWNRFTGAIPPEIGNLTNLIALSLHSNQFTGEYPKELGNLVNLQFLYLGNTSGSENYPANNRCTGSIPKEIGNLVNLERLWIKGEKNLTGSIPSEFGNFIKIWQIDLSGNKLTGTVPKELVSLSNLTKLDLSNNELTGLPRLPYNDDGKFMLEGNNFTFEDFENNMNIRIIKFTYIPQNGIGIAKDTTIDQGSCLTFSVSAGGTANHYQWTKDDVKISGATKSSYIILSASIKDEGTYVCKITNKKVPLLTLYTSPVNVTTNDTNDTTQLAKIFTLHQNYPNPFNPVTTIQYELSECSNVTLKIFNNLGQGVKTLINGIKKLGHHQIEWDGRDNSGQMVSTGIYFYRLKTKNDIAVRKMILQ
jgi:hypothetical protein